MPFLVVILFIVGLVVDLTIGSLAAMAISSFLHDNWWDVVPNLGFMEGILAGILVGCISYVLSISTPETNLFSVLFKSITSIVAIPLILPWVIGELNNNLIPAFPDMSYGTAFTFTLIGLGFALISGLISKLFTGILESAN